MNRKNVAVIFGGFSPEHQVSKISATTVINAMSQTKYNIIPIYITKEGKWLLYDGSLQNLKDIQWERFGTEAIISPDRSHKGILRIVGDKVKVIPLDVIFPVLHGLNGEDGTIQGLFELSGIPYVGCGVLASSVSMDKAFAKIIAKDLEVPQVEYLVLYEHELSDPAALAKKVKTKIGYPCFVKPANAGSSVGISKANNKKELDEAVLLAVQHDRKIIIERAVVGRELECAILGSGGEDTRASSVGEILPSAEFYDFDAKYNNSQSKTIVPADLPEDIQNKIRGYAIKIFKGVTGRGLARVDFFLEENTNKIIFNEINTLPGFTQISMYPKLWNHEGIEITDLIDHLIEIALEC